MSGAARPRLAVDVTPLLDDQWTGIPVFTRRLVEALEASGRVELEFCVRLNRLPAEPVRRAIRMGSGALLRALYERGALSAAGAIDPAVPLFYASVKEAPGVALREASTIHDIGTLTMPETHTPENVRYHLDPLRAQLRTDETVFCCSEATQAALVTAFPWVAPKTRVLHQYVEWPDNFDLLDRNQRPIGLGRYAVAVGTIEPRKNLGLLLRALEHPQVVASGIRFLVIGRRGWLVDQALSRLGAEARKRVVFTGFVSEFVKYRLIRHAEFLVMPSIYEGFGIPAVEAMSLGKPVLAARSSAFPDVVGEGGLYFDPLSVDEFAAAVAEVSDRKLQALIEPKALAQAATFTPARMAAPVLEWLERTPAG